EVVTTAKSAIWIGTVGQSNLIDGLIAQGRLHKNAIAGKREKFIITVIHQPAAGVESALVIAGSDKRGTIYGIYELSKQMRVSLCDYWAVAPVERKENLYTWCGMHSDGEPAVADRGIFRIDD